jgi:1-deoxy-D-xylulose-5-phosphate synthase
LGRAEVLRGGRDVALFGIGAGVKIVLDAADLLAELGISATVINARFCKPLDEETLVSAARRCGAVVTVEDGVARGGFGTGVLELLAERNVLVPTAIIGLPDHFVEHGTIPVLRGIAGLTAAEVSRRAQALLLPKASTNGTAKTSLKAELMGDAKVPAGVGS